MTRSVITPRIAYSGSGSTGPYTVPFDYLSNDHVLVYLIDSDDVSTLLTEGTNYTLSANVVTTTDTVDTGETLVIYRSTPVEQDGNFPANGSYSSVVTEAAFDKVVDQVSDLKARVDFFGLPLSGKAPTDAVNKNKYLKLNATGTALEPADGVDVSAFVPGQHCLVVATSNITLSGTQTIDGVGVVATNIVLAAGQTDKSENGVYVVAAGAWTRHTSHDDTDGLQAMTAFYVTSGTSYQDTIWVCGTLDPVVDTDDIYIGQLASDIGAANVLINSGGTINFNSGDVVGQHSANALAWTGGQWTITYNGGATSEPLRLVNSTDNASVEVLSLEGDRATMADNDEAYVSLKISNDAGTQTEIARLTWVATDVNNATSEDGRLDFAVLTAASLADKMQLTGTALAPSANDGIALGTTALGFSDLHLATGGVINFANGEMLITETANSLAVTGGSLSVTDGTAASTPAFTATNTTDAATVKAATFGGDRATFTDADTAYIALELSDDTGVQTEFGRISWHADDVSNGTEDGHLRFWTATAGSLNAELKLDGAALSPVTTGGLALGTTSLQYSGLYLAPGAPLNWDNGDITVTESGTVLRFDGGSSYEFYDAATIKLLTVGGGLTLYSVKMQENSGALRFYDASAFTFEQGSNDGAIITLSSTDVTHGVTNTAATDVFGMFGKTSATAGGLQVTGLAENGTVNAIRFLGVGDTDVTKSTAGTGVFSFDAYENDGTATAAAMTANSNLLVVRSNTTTRFILDADGDSHQDISTAWTNFDFLDDIGTLNAIAYHVARDDDPIKEKFNEWTLAKRESLEAVGLVSFGEDGRPFMNMSKLAMLNTGAIRQLGEQFSAAMSDKDEKIAALERRLMAIESKV